MSVDSEREIKIGDQTIRIARFRGLKAALAGALVSRVMREIPEFQDRMIAFRKEYREKNTVMITPAMAKLPRFEVLGLTPEDFASSGGKIEFPEEPDAQTIMLHVFPDLFDLADVEVRKFLAIIAIPNSELEEADDADQVDEYLIRWGKRLLREGTVDELLELVAIGMEVLEEQILRKKDRLGKLKGLPFLQKLLSTKEIPEPQQPNQTTPESTPSPPSVPASPSDSPPSSDGVEEPLSTVSPG